jgi:hypothetical protein
VFLMSNSSRESQRLSSLLDGRKVPSGTIVVIMTVALVCALFGFAFHVLWVVAIVDFTLGLGFVFANARPGRGS